MVKRRFVYAFQCGILGKLWYLIVSIPDLCHLSYFDTDSVQTYDQLYGLSYDVASGSEIKPCNKIDKPLVVYRFTGNVMTSITTLRT